MIHPVIACSVLALLATAAGAQQKRVQAGDPAPELALEQILQAPEGTKADWNSLAGQVVVLEFWATWCAPCVALIPHLNEVAAATKEQKVRFISITDQEAPLVEPLLARRSIDGWVGLDTDRSVFKDYGIQFIPQTVVVGPDGRIAAVTDAKSVTAKMLQDVLAGRFAPPAATEPAAAAPSRPAAAEEVPPRFSITIRPVQAASSSMSRSQGRFRMKGGSLRSILAVLRHVSKVRITGPSLLDTGSFELVATMAEGRKGALEDLVVQALEASFDVTVRREMRDTECFVLGVDSARPLALQKHDAPTGHVSDDDGVIAASAVRVGTLAQQLEVLLELPVVDETKLDGTWNWTILFEANQPQSIVDAVKAQGLSLSREQRSVEMIVVVPAPR